MKSTIRKFLEFAVLPVFLLAACQENFDAVIQGGTVIDPASVFRYR